MEGGGSGVLSPPPSYYKLYTGVCAYILHDDVQMRDTSSLLVYTCMHRLKRALHTLKRALHTLKRALHTGVCDYILHDDVQMRDTSSLLVYTCMHRSVITYYNMTYR